MPDKVFDPFYTTKFGGNDTEGNHERHGNWGCRSAMASCKALAGKFRLKI